MDEKLGNRLRKARAGKKLTQKALATLVGWDNAQGRISNYENDARTPTPQELARLAEVLEVSVTELLGSAGLAATDRGNVYQAAPTRGRVPIVSWVSAGAWQEAFDPFAPGTADDWADTEAPTSQSAFALRVRGDSMDNPRGEPTFPDGCIIVVEPALRGQVKSGDFVVARHDDWNEATFKQFVRDAGIALLRPLNPQWQTIQMAPGTAICGKVVEKIVRRRY